MYIDFAEKEIEVIGINHYLGAITKSYQKVRQISDETLERASVGRICGCGDCYCCKTRLAVIKYFGMEN